MSVEVHQMDSYDIVIDRNNKLVKINVDYECSLDDDLVEDIEFFADAHADAFLTKKLVPKSKVEHIDSVAPSFSSYFKTYQNKEKYLFTFQFKDKTDGNENCEEYCLSFGYETPTMKLNFWKDDVTLIFSLINDSDRKEIIKDFRDVFEKFRKYGFNFNRRYFKRCLFSKLENKEERESFKKTGTHSNCGKEWTLEMCCFF